MTSSIPETPIYTDMQGLSKLRYAAKENSPENLRAVAQQFEAIFMQMMLKNMRNTSLGDGIFDNDQTKFYQDMFDKQISLSMSQRNNLGIAEILIRQLGGQATDAVKVDTEIDLDSSERDHSPSQFVAMLKPAADDAGNKLGVKGEVLLAQAALETGWGKSVIKHPDGRSSHNLFGIKADDRWGGDRVNSQTIEYQDGKAIRKVEEFRAYENYSDSFNDYVKFIKENGRYETALSKVDKPAEYLHELQRAGYATDPKYAQKIGGILTRDVFNATS